jgi:2-oxoglutarate ferredoxin oxidoreductase subunit delta
LNTIILGKEIVMEKKSGKGKVKVNADYCKACEMCIIVCPNEVISLGSHINKMGYRAAEADAEKKCTACKLCATMCPEGAIDIYYNK